MMLLCPCVACDEGGGPLNDVTETTSGEEGGRITRLFLFSLYRLAVYLWLIRFRSRGGTSHRNDDCLFSAFQLPFSFSLIRSTDLFLFFPLKK